MGSFNRRPVTGLCRRSGFSSQSLPLRRVGKLCHNFLRRPLSRRPTLKTIEGPPSETVSPFLRRGDRSGGPTERVGRQMNTGHPWLLRALRARLAPSATAARVMSGVVFIIGLVMIGLASPAEARLGNSNISAVDQHAIEFVASASCPTAGEESDGVHAGDHCSAPCGSPVATSPSQSGPWRIPPTTDYAVALSAPISPRPDAPDPFPPRTPIHA